LNPRAVRFWRWALALSILVQLLALYWPRPRLPAGPAGSDLVVHGLLFAAVAGSAVMAGLAMLPVVALLVCHAVLSEVIQHWVVPGRNGDPLDTLADLAGTAAGVVLAWSYRSRCGADRMLGEDRLT